MPRHTRKERGYRVKVKSGDSFRSTRLLSGSQENAASRVHGGRILSVTKVSPEEVGRYGEFFKIGATLMREFRTGKREYVKEDRQFLPELLEKGRL